MNAVTTATVQEMKNHLLSRHVDMEMHTPWYDAHVATFLLYNLSGQLVGYQRYNPAFPSAFPGDGKQNNLRDRRYYNYVTAGQIGLFGLESYSSTAHVVFVTEGVFDACRLTKRGVCCFAMLTNNPSISMRNFLLCLGKPIIAVCDGDSPGIKLRKVGHHYETVQDGKDLGECSEGYVNYLLKKYC